MKFTTPRALTSWLFVASTFPLSLPFLMTLGLVRSGVIILGKIFRPDLVEPIKSLEMSFSADKFWANPKGANAFVWILDGPIDPDLIASRIRSFILCEKNIDNFKRFHSLQPTVWWGVPFWQTLNTFDDGAGSKSFSMDKHIIVENNDKKIIQSEEELHTFLSKYLTSPFKRGSPCWDVLCIKNFGVENTEDLKGTKSCFAFRIHHIVGDGFTMLKILENILDKVPTSKIMESQRTVASLDHHNDRKNWNLWLKKVIENFQNLFFTPLAFLHLVQDFACHSDFLTKKKNQQSPHHTFLSWTMIPLTKMKQVGHENFDQKKISGFGTIASYNLVLSGALGKFFEEKNKNFCAQNNQTNTGKFMKGATNLMASLPLSKTGRHPGFGNHWTHGIFRLPMDETVLEKRRKIIFDNCRLVSKLRLPQIYQKFPPFYALIPFCAVKTIVGHNMGAPIGLTNLPGPPKPAYLGGQKILNKFAVVGLQWDHAAMSFGFFSYHGTLSITLLAKRDIISSSEDVNAVLKQHFHDEIQNILDNNRHPDELKL